MKSKHKEQNKCILENETEFDSTVKLLKGGDLSAYSSWSDRVSTLVRCCTTCVPDSQNNEVPSGYLRNLLNIDHLHNLNFDEAPSWKYLRFIYDFEKIDLPVRDVAIKNDLFGLFRTILHILGAFFIGVYNTVISFTRKLLLLIVHYLVPICLERLIVHSGELQCVRNTLRSGAPVIFLPVYRSPMDYFFISIMFLLTKVPQPIIFKHRKENVRLSWIQRLFGIQVYIYDDQSPIQLMEENIMRCLSSGYPVMFHLEENPVRYSRLNSLNGDIMHFLIRACETETVEDVFIVPVNLNYDTVPVSSFEKDIFQTCSETSTWTEVRSVCKMLATQHGMCRITFNQPFSLLEMTSWFKRTPKNQFEYAVYPAYQSNMTAEQKALSNAIINHIVYGRSSTEVMMSTNIVSAAILYRNKDHLDLNDILEEFGRICDVVEKYHLVGFSGFELDIVIYAIQLLSPYLKMSVACATENDSDNDIQQIQNVTEWLKFNSALLFENDRYVFELNPRKEFATELSYYNDVVFHYLACDAIVVTSAWISHKNKGGERFSHNDVVELATMLCCLLQYEIVLCKSCSNLSQTIHECIYKLCSNDTLIPYEEGLLEEERWAQRYASTFDDRNVDNDYDDDEYGFDDFDDDRYDDGEVILSYKCDQNDDRDLFDMFFEQNNMDITSGSNVKYDLNTSFTNFYLRLIRPYLEVYTKTSAQLSTLQNDIISEVAFITNVVTSLNAFDDAGYSVDTVKNALKFFSKWGILSYFDESGCKFLRLNEPYLDPIHFDNVTRKMKLFS